MQPHKLESLLAESALVDGGFAPRLLVCHSHAEPQRIVEGAQGIGADVTQAWAGLVDTLIQTFRLAPEPVTIQPTTEALRCLNDYYNRTVDRQTADLRDVGSYAARWAEQCWRIAVCLHAGAHGANAGHRPIELETARNAITLAGWFAGEQLQILSAGRHAGRENLKGQVLGLLVDMPGGIRASDVYRRRIVTSAPEAHSLLWRLEAEGILEKHDLKPGAGGHVTQLYTRARK